MRFRDVINSAGYTILNLACTIVSSIDYSYTSHVQIFGFHNVCASFMLIGWWLAVRATLIFVANIISVIIISSSTLNKLCMRMALISWICLACYLYVYSNAVVLIPLIDGLLLIAATILLRIVQCCYMQETGWYHITELIILNCYSGLYLFNCPIRLTNMVPAILLIIAFAVGPLVKNSNQLRKIVSRLIIVVTFFAIFVFSFLEYHGREVEIAFAPTNRPWRSSYFSIILGIYLSIPLLWRMKNTISDQKELSTKTSIIVSCLCMTIVPILFCFTPHGVMLIMLSSIWLASVYVISSLIYRRHFLNMLTSRPLVSFVIFSLFVILIADRLFYRSLLSSLAPIFPIERTIIIFIISSGALTGIFGQIQRVKEYCIQIWRRNADFMTRWSVFVLIFSSSGAVIYVGMHLMFEYGVENHTSNVIKPSLEGFSGLDSLSWASSAYFVNFVFVLLNEIIPLLIQKCKFEE